MNIFDMNEGEESNIDDFDYMGQDILDEEDIALLMAELRTGE